MPIVRRRTRVVTSGPPTSNVEVDPVTGDMTIDDTVAFEPEPEIRDFDNSVMRDLFCGIMHNGARVMIHRRQRNEHEQEFLNDVFQLCHASITSSSLFMLCGLDNSAEGKIYYVTERVDGTLLQYLKSFDDSFVRKEEKRWDDTGDSFILEERWDMSDGLVEMVRGVVKAISKMEAKGFHLKAGALSLSKIFVIRRGNESPLAILFDGISHMEEGNCQCKSEFQKFVGIIFTTAKKAPSKNVEHLCKMLPEKKYMNWENLMERHPVLSCLRKKKYTLWHARDRRRKLREDPPPFDKNDMDTIQVASCSFRKFIIDLEHALEYSYMLDGSIQAVIGVEMESILEHFDHVFPGYLALVAQDCYGLAR